MIYLSSEIGSSGSIDYIKFYFNGNSNYTWNNMVVYMGHTTKSTFTSNDNWIAVGGLTQVYSGSIAVTNTAGWHTITLDSSFDYNGSDNLVIAIDDNHGSWISFSNQWNYTSTSPSIRCLHYRDYTTNPDPSSPPNGFLSDSRPNLTLNVTPTLVELLYFRAQGLHDFVRLEWATAAEIDSAGFHLWRRETKSSVFVRITDYLIPSVGSSFWGAKYEYEDIDLEPGRIYCYKLEEIGDGGFSTFYGPVSARLGVLDFIAPPSVNKMEVLSAR